MVSLGSRAVLAVLVTGLANPAAAQPPNPPLRLSLTCEQASELTFRFTIQNVSTAPTAAVIGMVLGNRTYIPQSLRLTVSRPRVPVVHLEYISPVGAVGGRIDPWLIALPAGASYSVAVPARRFRSESKLSEESFSQPANLRLRLTTREVGSLNPDSQGLAFINVWIGEVESELLRFPSQCSTTR